MAVEWTLTIEGRNEFGETCRKEVRIDKSWESLFDGDIGLSIGDSKKIMAALQNAVVNHDAETYALLRRFCPECHTFRPRQATRHARSEPSAAPLRFAITGCCAGNAVQGWSVLSAAEGNLSRSSDTGADGTDGAARKHAALPAGAEGARLN